MFPQQQELRLLVSALVIVLYNQQKMVITVKETQLHLQSGPSCSKLTTLLVNNSLKFQTLILQIHCYFLLKKCENPLHCKGFTHFFTAKDSHIFSTKNNSVFVTLADICLTNLCLNDIVKLTML